MSDVELIAAPLFEVRDVVETFRHHQIVEPDWADVLAAAVRALENLHDHVITHDVMRVRDELCTLLTEGLSGNEELVARVADETRKILKSATPPGLPTPDDDDWAFPRPTSS